jgi:acyl carrier protein
MSDRSEVPVDERVRAAIARALGLPDTASPGPLALGVTPGWDSMGHMTVVMEIETEFGASFPAHRLPELTDVDAIVRALGEEGA